MKRLLPAFLAALLLALLLGYLLGSAGTADAAPALRWAADEQAYYAALQPALRAMAEAASGKVAAAAQRQEDVTAAAQSILDLDAPTHLLAVGELSRFAASECSNVFDYLSGLKEEDWNAFSAGMIVEMRNHCVVALRDAQVELARFAAQNGGYPVAVGATATLTSTAIMTP